MNKIRFRILTLALLLLFCFDVGIAQSLLRLRNAYFNYINTGDENFLRIQVINEINAPDFVNGAIFLKEQNHPRVTQILLEMLPAYGRYDYLEEIFFVGPVNHNYRVTYKNLYYQTLFNNIKHETLLEVILDNILQKNVATNISFLETYHLVGLEFSYLNILAQKIDPKFDWMLEKVDQSLQKYRSILEKQNIDIERMKKIIHHQIYVNSKKKKIMKELFDSILVMQNKPKEVEALVSNPPDAPEVEPVIVNSTETNAVVNDELNSMKSFFNLDSFGEDTDFGNPSSTSSQPEENQFEKPKSVLDVAEIKIETQFLDQLYQEGYYINYINLYRDLAKRMHPSLPFYNDFQKNIPRLEKVIHYTQEKIASLSDWSSQGTQQPPSLRMKQLFYDNSYQEIITSFKNYQSSLYYRLALVALDRWQELFPLVSQDYPRLINYQSLDMLLNKPESLFEFLGKQPPDVLQAWQVDFLNFIEEGLDAKQIASLMSGIIFKTKGMDKKVNAQTTPPLLYEYTIANYAENMNEIGDREEVNRLFREYYNKMTINLYKEKLMFQHGVANLIKDPDAGQKIFFRILTINPLSAYRFEIEEVLNLMLW